MNSIRLQAHAFRTLAIVLVLALVATKSAQSQTFTVLHSFTGGADGAYPVGGLVRDGIGDLYGTTRTGGSSGSGTVFKVDATGKENVLYSFTGGADGGVPIAGLIRADGNLYGTTLEGAFNSGNVFAVDRKEKETVLYTFTGATDGGSPEAGLIRDEAGNLYGTTLQGGSGDGIVFKLDTTGKETVLYTFSGGADGGGPQFGVIRDYAGNLYGTTYGGGDLSCNAPFGCGVVFTIDVAGKETVLYTFTGGIDGANPSSGVIRDGSGNLYGSLYVGSTHQSAGAVFKVNRKGQETVLYNFIGGADGGYSYGGLIRDKAGNLYGTTNAFGEYGFGTVFEMNPLGDLTTLHAFTGGDDGGNPYAGLVRDLGGNLYGTANYGGSGGVGTVFEVTP